MSELINAFTNYHQTVENALEDKRVTPIERIDIMNAAIKTKNFETTDADQEHRIGAALHDWEYNDTIDKNDFVKNIKHCTGQLYETCKTLQKTQCNIQRVGGKMKDFKRDITTNKRYGLSFNAYVLKYPLSNVWFFNELFLHRLNRITCGKYCDKNKKFQVPYINYTYKDGGTPGNRQLSDSSVSANINGLHTKHYSYANNITYSKHFESEEKTIDKQPETKFVTEWDPVRKRSITHPVRTYIPADSKTAKSTDKPSVNSIMSFTIEETANRPDVFKNRLFMFIDGKLFTGLTIYTDGTDIMFVIDPTIEDSSESRIELKTLIEYCDENNDYDWTIIGMPFATAYESETYIPFNTDNDGKLYINPLSMKNTCSKLVNTNAYLLGIAPDSNNRDVMEMAFCYNLTDKAISLSDYYPPDVHDAIKNAVGSGRVHAFFTNLLNCKPILNVLNTDRIFQIPFSDEMKNPVPPENIILFEKIENGSLRLIHKYKITQYFPNVYKITDVDPKKKLCLIIFYGTNDKIDNFVNPIERYMNLSATYVTDVINGTLPKAILDYIPAKNEYWEYNYMRYHAKATRNIEYEYKLETLRKLINDDYTKLKSIYLRKLDRDNKHLHSSPKYVFTYSDIKDGIDEENNILTFKIQHPDTRSFKASVWIDGSYIDNVETATSKLVSTINVGIEDININENTIVTLELHKFMSANESSVEMILPPKDNSVRIPRGVFDAVSPQNLIVCVERDKHTSGTEYQKVWQVASNYELYWLIIGNTQYIDGKPVNYVEEKGANLNRYDVITENNGIGLLQDDDVVVIGNREIRFNGDVNLLSVEKDSSLKELDSENFYTVNDEVEDIESRANYPTVMQRRGYYERDRKRFFYYMPYSKDDPDIFITPITDFFANEKVLIKNTDVYFKKSWVVGEDCAFVFDSFNTDPNPENYRIFVDGMLIDYYYDYKIFAYEFNSDTSGGSSNITKEINLDGEWIMGSKLKFRIIKPLEPGHHLVTLEYVPYKYTLVYRAIESDGVITLRDNIQRPYDYKLFDVYANGKLLSEKQIEVVTDRTIYIPSIGNDDAIKQVNISIYEKAHDADVITHVWKDDIAHIHSNEILDSDSLIGTGTEVADHGECRTVDARSKTPINLGVMENLIRTDKDVKQKLLPNWSSARAQYEAARNIGLFSDS